MSVTLEPPVHGPVEQRDADRRRKAVEAARKTRALIESGEIDKVEQDAQDRFPQVLAILAA